MRFSPKIDPRVYSRYYTDVKRLSKRRDVVVCTGLILSLFTIAFFASFALRPTLVTIAGLLKELEEKREIDQKLEEKLTALQLAQSNYSLAAPDKPLVDEALPEEPYLSQLAYQLEALAQQKNLKIDSLSFDRVVLLGTGKEKKESLGAQEIAFTARFQGEYQDLSSFLATLSKLRRLIQVETFDFRKTEKEGVVTLTLVVSGKAYFTLGEKSTSF